MESKTAGQKVTKVIAFGFISLIVVTLLLLSAAFMREEFRQILSGISFRDWASSWNNRQQGYTHNSGQLSAEDKSNIEVVEKSILSKPEVMRAVVDDIGDRSKPLDSCTYWVQKVVERDAPIYDGKYPEHFEITCYTYVTGDSTELEFVWEVSDATVRTFRWGTVPVD